MDWSKFVAVNGASAHPHTDPDGTTYNMGNSYGIKGNLEKLHQVVWTAPFECVYLRCTEQHFPLAGQIKQLWFWGILNNAPHMSGDQKKESKCICADRSDLQHHQSATDQEYSWGYPGGSHCAVLHSLRRKEQTILLPQFWWATQIKQLIALKHEHWLIELFKESDSIFMCIRPRFLVDIDWSNMEHGYRLLYWSLAIGQQL